MKAIFHSISLLFIICYGSGCSSIRIARPDQWDPQVSATKQPTDYVAANNAYAVSSPATSVEQRRVWTKWWGLNQQNINPCNCYGPGLAEVKIKTNLAADFLSVVTLGCFQFYTVEWRCAKEPQHKERDF